MSRTAFIALIPLTMLGCGGVVDKYPTAQVTGKVLCNSKPVPGIQVVFGPIAEGKPEAGKSGLGEADDEGNFVVSTYGDKDGAVVGRHRIMVLAPNPDLDPNFRCDCEVNPKKILQEVEVTADGENEVTINLPAKTAATQAPVDDEDAADARQSELDAEKLHKGQ